MNALIAITEALDAIDLELDSYAMGSGNEVISAQQLRQFRLQLEAMKQHVESGCVPPRGERSAGMGRVIADSWPFDSTLGRLILRAEEQYVNAE